MFENIVGWFSEQDPIYAAFVAGLFTWGVTAVGASFVFFFIKLNRVVLDVALGFTGGVMVAAADKVFDELSTVVSGSRQVTG